ncbi:MAG: adenosylhomocysteinase [Candidatus Heimdallarchaeota archaeon]|nr:adenosylhomocysteinase [Candidatus Heimdallarchaeota archaeon]MCK5143171.1 adenosylhomocysteinase [Candidatus Heimdallarchaeota archaeon]
MEYKIKDISLAEEGRKNIDWAESRMPVLMELRREFAETKPLEGMRIAGCLHVTKETAVLVETLIASGAEVSWSGCNPLSTKDDIAAALAVKDIPIFAWYGMSNEEFYWAIDKVLEFKPTLTLDDGADLIFRVHSEFSDLAETMIGGTEETTTGVHRLRAMDRADKLLYPIIAVNDAETKSDFDNVYGTGQSTLDGVLRSTNIIIAGKIVVIAGYGHCGKGLAKNASGLGADVIITEVNPVQALKAAMDGFRVMKMDEAASLGDLFITATGMKDIIVKNHFESMKEGAIVCNTGHYDAEINIQALEDLSTSKREIRKNNEEYQMSDGRKVYLLAKGRLVNLSAAEGHPSEVMDMSFANQLLSLIQLAKEGKNLENKVYDIPDEQDRKIAGLKLSLMGYKIDKLTPEQEAYKDAYFEGT